MWRQPLFPCLMSSSNAGLLLWQQTIFSIPSVCVSWGLSRQPSSPRRGGSLPSHWLAGLQEPEPLRAPRSPLNPALSGASPSVTAAAPEFEGRLLLLLLLRMLLCAGRGRRASLFGRHSGSPVQQAERRWLAPLGVYSELASLRARLLCSLALSISVRATSGCQAARSASARAGAASSSLCPVRRRRGRGATSLGPGKDLPSFHPLSLGALHLGASAPAMWLQHPRRQPAGCWAGRKGRAGVCVPTGRRARGRDGDGVD